MDFGVDDGYVHVIDDVAKFDRNIGLTTIASLLGRSALDVRRQSHQKNKRHPGPEPTSIMTSRAVTEFTSHWQPFDWTTQLG